MKGTIAGALILACTIGCGDEPEPPAVASALGETGLALTEPDTGTYQLMISKEALTDQSEFLFSTSRIDTSLGEPNFTGMLSRVVMFKHADGEVQMLESQKGAAVDPQLTRPNLIASFPIVSETDSALGLDFNEGAATLLAVTDQQGSLPGATDLTLFGVRFTSSKLVQRYVDDGKTDRHGRITIRQIAQAQDGDAIATVEVRYFLQPYHPDPHYDRLTSQQDFRWAGFFETAPTLVAETNATQRFVTRFNPYRHTTYAISANTPAEVRGALRDGILYWNQVAGFDWLEVIDAPAGVTAPDLDYNLVQWVPERGAGAAYYDAQVDPLTGEIQNAQIYFPSSWYDVGAIYARDAYASEVEPDVDSATTLLPSARAADPQSAGARAMQNSHRLAACDGLNDRVFADVARIVQKHGLSAAQLKRAQLDVVRSVISHEVGHSLGLRHNFAGSLGTNIASSELDSLMAAYFASGEWPQDKLPGSSVMDYSATELDIAIGARIRLGLPALDYDILAIDTLYNDAPLGEGGPLFCTDSDIGTFLDCHWWDEGADRVASLQRAIVSQTDNAALTYLSQIGAAKQADRSDLFAFTRVDQRVTDAYGERAELARLVSDHSLLLASERAIGSPAVHADEIYADSRRRIGEAITAAGGFDTFFALLPTDFDQTFLAQLDQLLANPGYASGTTDTGQPWAFSQGDVEEIKAFAPEYLRQYHQYAALFDVKTLLLQTFFAPEDVVRDGVSDPYTAETLTWQPSVATTELEALLADRVAYYVGATRGELAATISAVDAEGNLVTREGSLPNFAFPAFLRAGAVGILAPTQSSDRAWAIASRNALTRAVVQALDRATGAPFGSLVLEGSDPTAQRWILDNRDVLAAFAKIQLN